MLQNILINVVNMYYRNRIKKPVQTKQNDLKTINRNGATNITNEAFYIYMSYNEIYLKQSETKRYAGTI